MGDFLAAFTLPEDIQERLAEALNALEPEAAAREQRRGALERELERAKRLFQIGDLDEASYLAERDRILGKLDALYEPASPADVAESFLAVMRNVQRA